MPYLPHLLKNRNSEVQRSGKTFKMRKIEQIYAQKLIRQKINRKKKKIVMQDLSLEPLALCVFIS